MGIVVPRKSLHQLASKPVPRLVKKKKGEYLRELVALCLDPAGGASGPALAKAVAKGKPPLEARIELLEGELALRRRQLHLVNRVLHQQSLMPAEQLIQAAHQLRVVSGKANAAASLPARAKSVKPSESEVDERRAAAEQAEPLSSSPPPPPPQAQQQRRRQSGEAAPAESSSGSTRASSAGRRSRIPSFKGRVQRTNADGAASATGQQEDHRPPPPKEAAPLPPTSPPRATGAAGDAGEEKAKLASSSAAGDAQGKVAQPTPATDDGPPASATAATTAAEGTKPTPSSTTKEKHTKAEGPEAPPTLIVSSNSSPEKRAAPLPPPPPPPPPPHEDHRVDHLPAPAYHAGHDHVGPRREQSQDSGQSLSRLSSTGSTSAMRKGRSRGDSSVSFADQPELQEMAAARTRAPKLGELKNASLGLSTDSEWGGLADDYEARDSDYDDDDDDEEDFGSDDEGGETVAYDDAGNTIPSDEQEGYSSYPAIPAFDMTAQPTPNVGVFLEDEESNGAEDDEDEDEEEEEDNDSTGEMQQIWNNRTTETTSGMATHSLGALASALRQGLDAFYRERTPVPPSSRTDEAEDARRQPLGKSTSNSESSV